MDKSEDYGFTERIEKINRIEKIDKVNENLISSKLINDLRDEVDNLRKQKDEYILKNERKEKINNDLLNNVQILEQRIINLTSENAELKEKRKIAKSEIKELERQTPRFINNYINKYTSKNITRKEDTRIPQNPLILLRKEIERIYKEFVYNNFANDSGNSLIKQKEEFISAEKKLNNMILEIKDLEEEFNDKLILSQGYNSMHEVKINSQVHRIVSPKPDFTSHYFTKIAKTNIQIVNNVKELRQNENNSIMSTLQ